MWKLSSGHRSRKIFYERLQLASSQFLKKVKALDYTKAMDIEGLRDTGRSIMDSFHEH